MELQVKVLAGEAGKLMVSVMGDRIEFCLGAERKVSFEGDFQDIKVSLVMDEEVTVTSVDIPEENLEVPHFFEEQEQPEQLFHKLTALRKQLAIEANLPPYIIFHDSTLSEMCRVLPKDLQEMKSIQGIGEAKLTKYGQRFLDCIREYAISVQQ